MKTRLFGPAILLGVLLTFSNRADAYCRTTTCDPRDPKQDCERDETGCILSGRELTWARPCLSFSVHEGGSKEREVEFETVHSIIARAYEKWTEVECDDGEQPSIEIADYGAIACGAAEYNSDLGNANVWTFRDDSWPYADAQATLALTTITFHRETGEIYDADVEINSHDNSITTTDTRVDADLESIVTHEAGHVFGLAHSAVFGATMQAGYRGGDLSLRTLSTDDVEAICTAFPSDREVPNGNCEPRHGFSSQCAADVSRGHCSVAFAGSRPGAGGPWWLCTLAALSLLRFRRARR